MAFMQPGMTKSKNQEEEGDQTDKDDKLNGSESLGPPGFYENDLQKYYAKFEGSRKARNDFKQRMKGKMAFTDTDWNQNVEKLGTSHGHRKNKQVVKVVNGLAQTLN